MLRFRSRSHYTTMTGTQMERGERRAELRGEHNHIVVARKLFARLWHYAQENPQVVDTFASFAVVTRNGGEHENDKFVNLISPCEESRFICVH